MRIPVVVTMSALGLFSVHAQTPKLPIGMNLPSNNYYSSCRIYTNVMKTASSWISFNATGDSPWNTEVADQILKDENGYPLELPYSVNGTPQAVRFLINNFYSGEFVFLYDGDGDFTFNVPGHEERNGRHYVTLDGQGGHVWIQIYRSDAADHVRNIRILPVAHEFSNSYPVFDSLFVEGLRPFHALRFMDWIGTNGSGQVSWSDRSTPTYYSQGVDRGMAFEYAIELANLVHADAWICVPHQADDNYHRQLAELVKTTLDPSLDVYVEYSNEIWNWAFSQSHWYTANAPGGEQYVQDDLRAVGQQYCDDPDSYCHPEKGAYMMARTFRLFQEAFTGADAGRLIRVAPVQHAWYDNTGRILNYLFNDDGNGCDAVSPAGYFNFGEDDHNTWNAMPPDQVTPEMVIEAVDNGFESTSGLWTRESAAYANQYGVDFIVYEGGQHMQPFNQGEWGYNQAVWDAQIAPGMYDLYMKNFSVHVEPEVNCKLFAAFSYMGSRESRYGSWGHLESMEQLLEMDRMMEIAPKYQALLDVNTPKETSTASQTQHVSHRDARNQPRMRRLVAGSPALSSVRPGGVRFDAIYDMRGARIESPVRSGRQPAAGVYIVRTVKQPGNPVESFR